jgi:RNA polymerase sigma-70 factor (ECF subfamily)
MQVKEQTTEKLISNAAWELNIRITTLKACDPEEAFSNEAMEIVRKTLEAMPRKTRRVFIMSRFENKSYNEIAEELNLTRKGVEFHISKTLKVLRYKLKDYLPANTSILF